MSQRSVPVLALLLMGGAWSLVRADSPAPPPPPAAEQSVAEVVARLELREAEQPVRDRAGWSPPKRIVVQPLGEDIVAELRPVAPNAEFILVENAEQARAAIGRADVLIGQGGSVCTPEVFTAAKRLRWVQTYSAGVERCVADDAFRKRGVLLTNMQRAYGPVMAEHVIGMTLALSRNLQPFILQQSHGRWDKSPSSTMQTLAGKTMLVVGLGGIGTEVARRAHALGMRVIATRASSRERPPFVEYVGLPDELAKLVADADVVVNALPLTPATRGLFDAAMFARMRPTSYFVNVGRGASVKTEDLLAALERGVIAGAALDVTDPEPPPPDHLLWRTRNLIVTPHVSGETRDDQGAMVAIVRENLRRYVAGERMLSVVDPERGY